MEGEKTFRPHVVMLPWLALGHITPYMELAKRLCDRGLRVYLCSTSSNFSSLKQKLQQKSYSAIETIEIRLPPIPGLPSHYESTSSLPPHIMPLLKKAFHSCKPAITNILRTLNPDFIIHDFIPSWVHVLANELNIHAIQFLTLNASCLCFCNFLFGMAATIDLPDSPLKSLELHEFEWRRTDKLLHEDQDGAEVMEVLVRWMNKTEGLLVLKTARTLEAKFLDYFRELTGNKVTPVGILVPQPPQEQTHQLSTNQFTEWLDARKTSSVVFVSFGSEYFMSKGEIAEIAFGLELSEQSFIWVIRLVKEEEEEEVEQEEEEEANVMERVLPLGFLERVKGRGMVVSRWAPQMAILSHPATGGFLTHCGWGSLCEGMACGVPFIALPLNLDQPINAKLVVGVLGLGVEVERERSGEFRNEKVTQAIRRVMVGPEGEKLKSRAKEMMGNLKVEGEEGVDELLGEMERMCTDGGRKVRVHF